MRNSECFFFFQSVDDSIPGIQYVTDALLGQPAPPIPVKPALPPPPALVSKPPSSPPPSSKPASKKEESSKKQNEFSEKKTDTKKKEEDTTAPLENTVKGLE